MTNNALILADEVCLETIIFLLLYSFKNLVDDLNSVTINIQTILTGMEISIKFNGKKVKKHNVEKFINCIDNRLYLNHLREYDADILIVNYLIHLLKFDIREVVFNVVPNPWLLAAFLADILESLLTSRRYRNVFRILP